MQENITQNSFSNKNPTVAIIILNWNGKDDTIECLESLKHITYPNYEILLVDNGSTDGSVGCFRERYPGMEIIENGTNLGFAEGNNVGIRRAMDEGADYVLLLNNDTVVDLEFLGELVKVAEGDERIGIVGPKICYYDNPTIVWSVGGKINFFTSSIGNYGDGIVQTNFTGVENVDYVSGCALLIKNEVIMNIGLLDKDYFLYFEETDWNVRAHNHGYISVVNRDTRILHKSGASVKKVKDSNYYYFARNTLLFLKKNGKWYHYIVFCPLFITQYFSILVFNLVKGNKIRYKNIICGVTDFIKGNYGDQHTKS